MKTVRYILLLFIYFGVVSSLFGQILQPSWVTKFEDYYDNIKKKTKYYVDDYPDTLIYKGKTYFFRQTPFSLKKGYINIFYNEDVGSNIIVSLEPIGFKGFTATWIIRNDSLLIKNIYPGFYNYMPVVDKDGVAQKNADGSLKRQYTGGCYIHDDTIVARFEKFTGNKFRNGLLHIDWINGDFGVITSYIGKYWGVQSAYDNKTRHYRDEREGGFIMTFKNGKLKKMKKDKREFKN
jgi:hypothetical protein